MAIMTDGTLPARGTSAPKVAFFNDPKTRSLIFQGLALALLVFVVFTAVSNAVTNLRNQNIAGGFGFLDQTAHLHDPGLKTLQLAIEGR